MKNSYSTILLDNKETVAVLTFNRPGVLNAMNLEMMEEIIDALQMITSDTHLRAAVITGNGRAFMAGADIKEYALYTKEQFQHFQQKGRELYDLIERSAIPFIAALNGDALGGGFEIALSCDLIIAARSAGMGLPEARLGLIPGGGGTQRLSQKTGINRVKEMLFFGERYPAEKMHEWGIVNVLAEDHSLMETALETAGRLTHRPAQAIQSVKQMLAPAFAGQPFSQRLDKEGDIVLELFQTPVAKAFIQSFVNKKK